MKENNESSRSNNQNKTFKTCKATTNQGRCCEKDAILGGYCMMHYMKYLYKPKKKEKLRPSLSTS